MAERVFVVVDKAVKDNMGFGRMAVDKDVVVVGMVAGGKVVVVVDKAVEDNMGVDMLVVDKDTVVVDKAEDNKEVVAVMEGNKEVVEDKEVVDEDKEVVDVVVGKIVDMVIVDMVAVFDKEIGKCEVKGSPMVFFEEFVEYFEGLLDRWKMEKLV